MDPSIAAQALACASATLTDGHDVPGTLVALLNGCRVALDVDTAGLLVQSQGRLELLSASSHAVAELETHQAQIDEGPCVDAHASGGSVAVAGADLIERWPTFGTTMVEAGFHAVHASPLRWHQSNLGAMGLFRRSAEPFTDQDDVFAQAFADIASALILSTDQLTAAELSERLRTALASRVVIEQAKGVLAELRGVDMAAAYEQLVRAAEERGEPLATWATRVVHEAGPGGRLTR
jgi:hypothetical protein